MSLDYLELLYIMESNQDPLNGALMDSGEESRGLKVIRTGLNLHQQKDNTFWEDFMQLCGDSEGMAELLKVKPAEVRRWANKIRDAIEQVKNTDSTNPEGQDDKKILPTGDNGALTVDKGLSNF